MEAPTVDYGRCGSTKKEDEYKQEENTFFGAVI